MVHQIYWVQSALSSFSKKSSLRIWDSQSSTPKPKSDFNLPKQTLVQELVTWPSSRASFFSITKKWSVDYVLWDVLFGQFICNKFLITVSFLAFIYVNISRSHSSQYWHEPLCELSSSTLYFSLVLGMFGCHDVNFSRPVKERKNNNKPSKNKHKTKV